MQCSIVFYCTVQYSKDAVKYSDVQCRRVVYCTVKYSNDAVIYSAVIYSAVQGRIVLCTKVHGIVALGIINTVSLT